MSLLDLMPMKTPPKVGATPEALNKWHWSLYFSVLFLGVSIFAIGYGSYALAFGAWPKVFPGFATVDLVGTLTDKQANSLKAVISKQNDSALRQIRQDLLNNIKSRCYAQKGHNQGAVGTYTEIIQTLELEYFKLAGTEYHEPSCDAV